MSTAWPGAPRPRGRHPFDRARTPQSEQPITFGVFSVSSSRSPSLSLASSTRDPAKS